MSKEGYASFLIAAIMLFASGFMAGGVYGKYQAIKKLAEICYSVGVK